MCILSRIFDTSDPFPTNSLSFACFDSHAVSMYLTIDLHTCCFDKLMDDPLACNSGTCVDYNKCECDSEHTGNECELNYYCFRIPSNETTGVCNKGGKCTGKDKCSCFAEFEGDECELMYCYGVLSNESSSSNSGVCTWIDTCDCSGTNYIGDNCEKLCECQNDGICIGDSTSLCDCTGTGFIGPLCNIDPNECNVDCNVDSNVCNCTTGNVPTVLRTITDWIRSLLSGNGNIWAFICIVSLVANVALFCLVLVACMCPGCTCCLLSLKKKKKRGDHKYEELKSFEH